MTIENRLKRLETKLNTGQDIIVLCIVNGDSITRCENGIESTISLSEYETMTKGKKVIELK